MANKLIEIGGEVYALDKIPDEQSAVVLAKREKLLEIVNLEALVVNLGRVGGFIRIAYNSIGADPRIISKTPTIDYFFQFIVYVHLYCI